MRRLQVKMYAVALAALLSIAYVWAAYIVISTHVDPDACGAWRKQCAILTDVMGMSEWVHDAGLAYVSGTSTTTSIILCVCAWAAHLSTTSFPHPRPSPTVSPIPTVRPSPTVRPPPPAPLHHRTATAPQSLPAHALTRNADVSFVVGTNTGYIQHGDHGVFNYYHPAASALLDEWVDDDALEGDYSRDASRQTR